MEEKFRSCLYMCKIQCDKYLESNLAQHYEIVDVDSKSFTIVPINEASFYSWEEFAHIIECCDCSCYFRLYFRKDDNSECVSLRVFS